MSKEPMDSLIWHSLYSLIERSYQQTLCCQRYVDKKRKIKRITDWSLVVIPGLGGLLYFWEPLATLITSVSTVAVAFLNNVVPYMTQSESELKELDDLSLKLASIRADAEDLVMQYREDKSVGDTEVRKSYLKLQKSLDAIEVKTNVLLHNISKRENDYLESETIKYLKKYHNG